MAIKVVSLQNWDINEIIYEVGQPNIKMVIYFFSPSFEEYKPQEAIAKAFPAAVCIGASMYGGWSNRGAIESGITVMSLSSDEIEEIYLSYQEGVKKTPIKAAHAAIAELKKAIMGKQINPDEYLGLMFFDGLCLGELIIKEFTMEQDFNLAFIGGAAADEMLHTKTLVSAGTWLSSDGLVAVIMKMKIPFFFNHYVHYIPTKTSFVITRVEITHRIAWEINGEPAADFYARQIGLKDAGQLTKKIFAKHPLGLLFGESIYIRSPNKVVEGGGLMFYCHIEAGSRVFLLESGDIIKNTQESISAVSQFLPGIQGCLIFNCVQRHLELIELGKINEFNDIFSNYPMIGFNTFGEELFTHHNQTLTAVFFGTLPEKELTDPYKTKRLFHYSNSKLKCLVFDIVSRSELLNITISYLKGSIDADSGIMSGESFRTNYETIKKSLGTMIEQSNVSKEDIEKMLVVYQNNVEKTSEYVFNIADEISAQNHRLKELREEAITASRTKTNFLASMSHEIRTPMNAITGIAELLLRTDLSDEARGYVQDIKQAGSNLVSIINDILDFSKIEAGRMELIPVSYQLASLVNDTVNIIRTRIKEKPIRFFTNIDSKIPAKLFGDVVRLRQILNNLLSNAVKFTEKGFVSLSITVQKREAKQIWLKFEVSDTGRGISKTDKEKLFNEFVQVDLRRNRDIEGTGLGLAITKRLCTLMHGDISVDSEYGKGSKFTATLLQDIDSQQPFALVEDAKNKKVLVYERRLVYGKSVCWSLENMGVPYTMVTTLKDFSEALIKEEWPLVLSGYGLHQKIKQIMDSPSLYPKGKSSQLALMVEWGTEAYIPNVRFMSLPVQSLSIANILNGKKDNKDFNEGFNAIKNIFPGAKLLVVDDIQTNLRVVEGLLAPYRTVVDTCLTGKEALSLIQENHYDLVLMDHMMPGMDGIETAYLIRERERREMQNSKVPIIALTANAVSGVREMFLEKGFNDYLAKPIDVSKLDDILNKWINAEKREKNTGKKIKTFTAQTFPDIPGINTDRGIKMTGGTKEGYISVLSIFKNDAKERLLLLKKDIIPENIDHFVLQLHSIKSAAASIGAQNISDEALKLENAGKDGDVLFLCQNIEKFVEQLTKLTEGVEAALEVVKDENNNGSGDGGKSACLTVLLPLLRGLEKALKESSILEIDRILNELNLQALDLETKEALEKISEDVLMAEFDSALKTYEEFFS